MPNFSHYLPRSSSRALALAVVVLVAVGALSLSYRQVDALVSGGSIALNGCTVEVTLNGNGTASTGRYGTITFSSVFSNELVTCANSSAPYFSALCTAASGSHTFQYAHTGGPGSVTVSFVNAPTDPFRIDLGCAAGATCFSQTLSLPDCTAPPPPSGGGGTTTSAPVLPPLDPPGTAPRVYGGYDNPGSEVVVYQQPFGYQFYSYTGVPVGQVTLSAVGIPGAGGLITSMSNDEFRADLFYDGGDYLRVKFYINGQLVEDGRFQVPGIGARAGEVAGGGTGGGGGGGTASGGTLQVLCSQRLRLEATLNSVVVDVLQRGDVLSVIGRSNDNTWFNVTTADNLTGWVFYGQCINVNSSSINNAPIQVEFEGRPTIGEQQAQPAAGQGLIQVSAPPGTPVAGFSCGQNLRSGPGNDYFVIRVIPAGSSMIVTGRSNDLTWVQLSAGTLNGWATLGGCIAPIQGDVSAAPVLVDLSN